jgi:hypothetical protein
MINPPDPHRIEIPTGTIPANNHCNGNTPVESRIFQSNQDSHFYGESQVPSFASFADERNIAPHTVQGLELPTTSPVFNLNAVNAAQLMQDFDLISVQNAAQLMQTFDIASFDTINAAQLMRDFDIFLPAPDVVVEDS